MRRTDSCDEREEARPLGGLAEFPGTDEGLVVRRMALRRRRRRAAFTGRVVSAVVILMSAWGILAATASTLVGH